MTKVLPSFSAPDHVDPQWNIAIIHTQYHQAHIDQMVAAAVDTLQLAGIAGDHIQTYAVLGAFEVPLIGARLAQQGTYHALMGFGGIIKGDTKHDEHLAREVTRAMMDIQLQYHLPFSYEILHVDNEKQLQERCSGEQNKGKEAAYAVLHSLAQLARIQS